MRLRIVGIGLESLCHGEAAAIEILLLLVELGKLEPMRRTVRIQSNGGFIFLAGSVEIQALGRVVVNLGKDKVIIGVAGIVTDRTFVHRRIHRLASSNPRGEKKPPRSVDEGAGRHENQDDCDDSTRPGIERNLPVAAESVVGSLQASSGPGRTFRTVDDAESLLPVYRWSIGVHLRPGAGPTYSARGRIKRLLEYCSRMCAVHPETRLTPKNGVNRSIGMPLT